MQHSKIRREASRARAKLRPSILLEGMLVANANDDGVTSVKVTDSDTKNLVWVQIPTQDDYIQAINTKVSPREGMPVLLRHLSNGAYVVAEGDPVAGTDLYGEAAATVFTPELIGELLATVWGARNLKMGRVRLSEIGGMNVYVEAFYTHSGRFAGATLDLTTYVPATTDKQVWALIWYDPSAAALGVTKGTEYSLPYTMQESDLAAISISAQYIPLAGVILTEGDTAVSANTVIVARQPWLDSAVTDNNFFPIEITTALTIPANRQIAVRRLAVTGSGVLTVSGVLDIF